MLWRHLAIETESRRFTAGTIS